jgi:hypothetical protein
MAGAALVRRGRAGLRGVLGGLEVRPALGIAKSLVAAAAFRPHAQ